MKKLVKVYKSNMFLINITIFFLVNFCAIANIHRELMSFFILLIKKIIVYNLLLYLLYK